MRRVGGVIGGVGVREWVSRVWEVSVRLNIESWGVSELCSGAQWVSETCGGVWCVFGVCDDTWGVHEVCDKGRWCHRWCGSD